MKPGTLSDFPFKLDWSYPNIIRMASSENSQNHDGNTLIALLSDIRDILRNQEARLSRIEDACAPISAKVEELEETTQASTGPLSSHSKKDKEVQTEVESDSAQQEGEAVASASSPPSPDTQFSPA
jgi:hypothetical protein